MTPTSIDRSELQDQWLAESDPAIKRELEAYRKGDCQYRYGFHAGMSAMCSAVIEGQEPHAAFLAIMDRIKAIQAQEREAVKR